MKALKSPGAEEGAGGIIRKLSLILPPLTPRIVRARSKSMTHVSSKYESLDYDVWVNDLLIKEEQCKSYRQIVEINTLRWVLYLAVGLIVGLIAVFIDWTIDILLNFQRDMLLNYTFECSDGRSCYFFSYLLWYASFVIATAMGTLLVVFVEPGAAGSGMPYIISYLNGVSIPKFTTLKVLIVKIFGVIFIQAAGLAAGKEGPLIHIGSVVGGIMISVLKSLRLPLLFDRLTLLNTNQEKRDLMAAGCAAGISTAFGSPVGATLMSLEEGTSFWSVLLMWRIFFCAIVSTFVFNTTIALIRDDFYAEQSGLFYFGRFNETTLDYKYVEFPLFFVVGVIGGSLGALFVFCTAKISAFRLRNANTRWLQFCEAVAVAVVTATLGIVLIEFFQSCISVKDKNGFLKYGLQMYCADGSFNEMSVYWLQGQEGTLRLLFHGGKDIFQLQSLTAYFILYFVLLCLTAGISMPVGLFIPSLLLGATWGRIFGIVLLKTFPYLPESTPVKYALIGAAAQLGGVVRITLSLTVVIIEASGALTFGFPIMFTLFVTKWVGDFFTEGVYESQINILGLPILPADPPPLTSDIKAKDLMNTKVVAFSTHVTVGCLIETLERVKHQGFPVVKKTSCSMRSSDEDLDTYGELRGFIFRSQLMTLLLTKSFNVPETAQDVREMLILFRKYEYSNISLQELKFTDEEKQAFIDLRPYMNPSPYAVQMVMSFPRTFRLLRSLGLRHVMVVDNTNQVLGIITRKDLAKFRLWRHATSMGLKELRVQ